VGDVFAFAVAVGRLENDPAGVDLDWLVAEVEQDEQRFVCADALIAEDVVVRRDGLHFAVDERGVNAAQVNKGAVEGEHGVGVAFVGGDVGDGVIRSDRQPGLAGGESGKRG
jgi:hypothetical protein